MSATRLGLRVVEKAIRRPGFRLMSQHSLSSLCHVSRAQVRQEQSSSNLLASMEYLKQPLGSHGKLSTRSAHSSASTSSSTRLVRGPRSAKRLKRLRNLLILLSLLSALYYTYSPFRHSVIAAVRCARLMKAVVLDVLDYKRTFKAEEKIGEPGRQLTLDERFARTTARKECHKRSAERLLDALKKNSGIYVKLGQHVAAVQVLPKEWTATMRPLQDQCFPTPLEDMDAMLRRDLGAGLDDLFSDFEPNPIGVASLAQVHRAIDKRTGKHVAVKVQHADLEDFVKVDMASVNFAIGLVRYIFPEFEFGWLGTEMNEMLPMEMDFRQEATNSSICRSQFAHLQGKTSLYLPEILWAEKRCMVMEYIAGARIDNLAYLNEHGIDRNQVSQELSRIFSQMVYLNGYFHADPHHGNLLIRSKAKNSHSPYNFDVCLLDHGQYFDIPDDLRVNYARFWLALIKSNSEATTRERKKYAKLIGNIDDDMYPILESAITGRISMASADDGKYGASLLDKRTEDKDFSKVRSAVVEADGLVTSIFGLLRTVPRRLLMILKLSDLQRSLDLSLATTHGQSRIFLIVARYCADAVWQSDVKHFRSTHFSLYSLADLARGWYEYVSWSPMLGVAELGLDVKARAVKVRLWMNGLSKAGLRGAQQQMAGLQV